MRNIKCRSFYPICNIIIPIIIEIIIGEIGLFSNSNSLEPNVLDISIEINALNTHKIIPTTNSLLNLYKKLPISYYT